MQSGSKSSNLDFQIFLNLLCFPWLSRLNFLWVGKDIIPQAEPKLVEWPVLSLTRESTLYDTAAYVHTAVFSTHNSQCTYKCFIHKQLLFTHSTSHRILHAYTRCCSRFSWEVTATGVRISPSPLQPPNCLAFHFIGSSLYERNPKFSFFLTATYSRGESTQRRVRTLSRRSYHLFLQLANQSLPLPFFLFVPFFRIFPRSPYAYKEVMNIIDSGSGEVVVCTPASCNTPVHQCLLHTMQDIAAHQVWFPNKKLKLCRPLKLLKEQFKNSVSFLQYQNYIKSMAILQGDL